MQTKRFFAEKKPGWEGNRKELRHDKVNFNLISFGLAQNEIRFTYTQLDSAAKGGPVDHRNPGQRGNAQIEQPLPHRTAGVVPFHADTAAGGNVTEQPAFFPARRRLAALRAAMMGTLFFRPPELHCQTFLYAISAVD
jgi:hypothetical protein